MKKKPNGHWTLERCKEDALKYQTIRDWRKASSSAYASAAQKKFLQECCQHMMALKSSNGYWTLETCKLDALRYQTRNEWRRSSYGYHLAHKNKWLEECCRHMEQITKPKNYWTLETCKADALQYNSRIEWESSNPSAINTARKRGWLEECCSGMRASCNISSLERSLFSTIKEKYPKVQHVKIIAKNFFSNKPHIFGFELDIYIPELRKGIEFNGSYWHSEAGLKRSRGHWPQEDIDNYHQLKRDFFKSRDIEYIEVWESEWLKDPQSCIDRCLEFLKTI